MYRARDTKLDRDVALKVLPQAFTDDPDRLARFEREAKVLASLNHPNIGSIYGLEEAEGQKALVLELVEGPTLAERIKQGPIPVDEALPIAKQIAEALEAAHEQGIIHRDLKPANIKVKDDGTVKVLDFGLAKAMDRTPSGDPSESPTLTASATALGVIMGTAAYMSPEQARGRPVDKRSDIWAFGAVLYEMLSGKRPFQGRDVSETLGAVLRLEPGWDTLPSETPPRLSTLLRRCLEKEPKQRVHDVADVRLAMEGAFESSTDVRGADSATSPWRERLAWSVVAVLGVGLAVAAQWTRPTVQPPAVTFSVSVEGTVDAVALSPDGEYVAYTITAPRQLWVRSRNSLEPRPLPGTEEAHAPFWSPDGSAIGFFVSNQLKIVGLEGEPPRTVGMGGTPLLTGTWGPNDVILFGATVGPYGLFQVPVAGGEFQSVTTVDEASGHVRHTLPVFLPDGEHYLTVVQRETERFVHLGSLDGGLDSSPLIRADEIHYASEHIIFRRGDSLFAQMFDPNRHVLSGSPVRLLAEPFPSESLFSVSGDGGLVHVVGGGGVLSQLQWVGRAGESLGLIGSPGNYSSPVLSPDESRVAVVRDGDIWILDPTRGTEQRVTSHPESELYPVWSPDGRSIVFSSDRRVQPGLYEVSSTGAGDEHLFFEGGDEHLFFLGGVVPPYAFDWSEARNAITYAQPFGATLFDVWELSLSDPRQAVALRDGPFWESGGVFSPNGRWLAYYASQSENSRLQDFEVYVLDLLDGGGQWPISTDGGFYPKWRADGRELYYLNGNDMMAAPFRVDGETVVAGIPERLFEAPFRTAGQAASRFDVSDDGERFLVNVAPASESAPIAWILDWQASLRRQ